MKRRLGKDELGLSKDRWTSTLDGPKSNMNTRERSIHREICQEERDRLQICGAIHAETRQEGLKKLSEREEQDAKHRPGRIGQARKKVDSRQGRPVPADPLGADRWTKKIAGLSREQAKRLHAKFKAQHLGHEWPKWFCVVMRQLEKKAITVESMPIHPSALAMYADGNDPREGSGVVSAGGM